MSKDPLDFDFDFGFVNEDELESVQEVKTETENYKQRLDALYQSIQPLLKNLKRNPEKEYIKWADRVSKVESFEKHIKKIYEGDL